MTENRRFYYLKLKENFYNSETMVILESMQIGRASCRERV